MFIQAEKVHVTLHYYRFDGDYRDWNVWAWPYGLGGAEYCFSEMDGNGATARFIVEPMEQAPKIGFIIRQSKLGDDWASRECSDRFIEHVAGDKAEIWIIQGDSRVYYEETSAREARRPRIVSADWIDADSIAAKLNKPYQLQDDWENKFRLIDVTEQDAAVPITQIRPADLSAEGIARSFHVQSSQPVNLGHTYRLELDGWEPASVSVSGLFDSTAFQQLYTYKGNDLGAVYHSTHTPFCLWSPVAEAACVIIYDSWDQTEGLQIPMTRSDHGTWRVCVEGDLRGKFYMYRVKVRGHWNEAADPYARALSINGLKGAVIDLEESNPPDWEHDARPSFLHPADAVIYELHVRDASIHPASGVQAKGKYLGLTEAGARGPKGINTGLDYLSELGITHVQLLPISDFVSIDETQEPPKRYNWGYDPGHYFVPEGSYTTDPYEPAVRIKEFKQLIQAMHARGIRVVMDVVFNHMFSTEPSNLGKLVPGYYFRRWPDGRLANGTGVGNDTASERTMMRKLIVDAVVYWAKEYHIDGFRFDLMGIHDVDTMNEVRAALDQIDPSILVYGEGWYMHTPLDDRDKANQQNAEQMPRIGQFNDRFRDGLKGNLFDCNQRGFINGGGIRSLDVKSGIVGGIRYNEYISGFAISPEQTINFVEVHDNLTLWDKLLLSNPDDTPEMRRRMHRLATAIVLTSQGIPFLHAGQEFYRTKYGVHNSYRSPDGVNRLDWERLAVHASAKEYVKGLIALRKATPQLRMRSSEDIRERLQFIESPEGTIVYFIQGESYQADVVVAHNGSRSLFELELPEAPTGGWKLHCDGDRAGVHPLELVTQQRISVPPLSTFLLRR